MALSGGSIKKENIVKEGASTDFSQYFLAHCPDGITDARSYEKITIKEINNIDKPGNGKQKGEIIQDGVYVYKISVKDFKDEKHYYVGNVSLVK